MNLLYRSTITVDLCRFFSHVHRLISHVSSIFIKLTFYASFFFVCMLNRVHLARMKATRVAHRSSDRSSAFCNTKRVWRWSIIRPILTWTSHIHAHKEWCSHQSVRDEDVDLINEFCARSNTLHLGGCIRIVSLELFLFSYSHHIFFVILLALFFYLEHERNEWVSMSHEREQMNSGEHVWMRENKKRRFTCRLFISKYHIYLHRIHWNIKYIRNLIQTDRS